MKPRHLIAIALAVPATAGVAYVTQHAIQSYRDAAEAEYRASMGLGASPIPPELLAVSEPGYRTADELEQQRASAAMYAELAADMERRCATKSGICEPDETPIVIDGAPFEAEAPDLDYVPMLAGIVPPKPHEIIAPLYAAPMPPIPARSGGVNRRPVASVPEPSPLALMLAGVALIWRRRAQ